MPVDDTLGFTNIWYADALANATDYPLTADLTIRLLTPMHFLATKFEAYNGRGNGDVLSSRDIEDIVNLINGIDSLLMDIEQNHNFELHNYIAKELLALLDHSDFEYVLQSATNGDNDRIDYIFERIQRVVEPVNL